jgi:nitroreductase
MQNLTELLRSHRSIRRYKPDPVPQDLLERICADAIAGSSSSGNLNSVSLVLTRDPERKRRLYEFHSEQEMVLQAPLVITFCADWYRTRQWLKLRGARDNFGNLLGYHVAAFDAMILSQSICLALEAEGLGICYMGTTLSSMRGIADFLELPETCLPVTSIVAGYPDEDPPKRDRLPLRAFLHEETYRRPDDRELEEIYAEREVRGWARYTANPELKARLEELGVTTLAQFYTSTAKYDPDEFRRDSAELRAVIEATGFMP